MTARKEFWMLLAMFLLPIAFGTLFFYANPNYFSESTVNYGELVRPVIATDEGDITDNGQFIYIMNENNLANVDSFVPPLGIFSKEVTEDIDQYIQSLLNDE